MKFTIEFAQDENPESPREWDNLGTMVCWHKRYKLGDAQPKEPPEEWLESLAKEIDGSGRLEYWEGKCLDAGLGASADRADEQYKKAVEQILEREVIMLPLFLYDHSGITMSTRPFSCPWDSGQVGYIFVTIASAREEFSWKRMSPKRRARVEEMLTAEVKEYDKYLRGEVFGFTVQDENGDVVDSCWGFYELTAVQEAAIDALKAAF